MPDPPPQDKIIRGSGVIINTCALPEDALLHIRELFKSASFGWEWRRASEPHHSTPPPDTPFAVDTLLVIDHERLYHALNTAVQKIRDEHITVVRLTKSGGVSCLPMCTADFTQICQSPTSSPIPLTKRSLCATKAFGGWPSSSASASISMDRAPPSRGLLGEKGGCANQHLPHPLLAEQRRLAGNAPALV